MERLTQPSADLSTIPIGRLVTLGQHDQACPGTREHLTNAAPPGNSPQDKLTTKSQALETLARRKRMQPYAHQALIKPRGASSVARDAAERLAWHFAGRETQGRQSGRRQIRVNKPAAVNGGATKFWIALSRAQTREPSRQTRPAKLDLKALPLALNNHDRTKGAGPWRRPGDNGLAGFAGHGLPRARWRHARSLLSWWAGMVAKQPWPCLLLP